MERRMATTSDIDAVTGTIALAFATDPVWGPALARPDGRTDHQGPYWRLFVAHSVAQGGAFLADDTMVASYELGGGWEHFVSKHFGFRGGLDYIYTDAFHSSENNVRLGVGIVIR